MMIAVLVVFAVVILATIYIYNLLITKRNDVKNAFAQIDIQLTRRYDLIPNLVTVAQKYLQHERETLTAVIDARNQALAALQASRKNQELAPLTAANQALEKQLASLYATFENYPNLKADTQMTELHEEIVSTENRIAFARQCFNDSVTEYNSALQAFPNNLVAHLGHFPPAEWLEIPDVERKRDPVKISFE